MNNNLNISFKVFLNSDSSKPILERDLFIHPDVSVPYNQILSVMRFLFGSNCVVEFKSSFLKSM